MIRNIFSTLKELLRSKMAGDVMWTFAGQVLVLLASFALNKVLSGRLDVDSFGEYNLIKRSVTVISFVMLAGTGIAMPRYLAIYLGKGDNARAKAFVRAAILFVATAMVAMCAAATIFKPKLYAIVTGRDDILLYIVAFVYAAMLTASTMIYVYFRGKNDFKRFTISNVLIQLLLPASALIIPGINTLNIFVWWTIITAVVTLFFAIGESMRGGLHCSERITKQALKAEYKTVAKYALPRLWGDFFLFAFQAFPLVYINHHYNNESVAYYSVGITIITLGTAFYSFLGYILLPYVSKCLSKGNIRDAIRKVNYFTVIYVLSAILVMAAFYLLTSDMIQLLFTSEYLVAESLTQIMILAILPQAIYLLYRNPIDAVSVFPFNTVVLGVSFAALVGVFYMSSTFENLAWGYVAVSCLQGFGAFVTWHLLKKRHSKPVSVSQHTSEDSRTNEE
ncbi:MAG: lipopolysaccharide biosynthesis protein [Bacteroidales bacterium]|nr:lipopolysaccharide biosynthesis protein [Bacteroidales bacterium]